MFDPTTPVSDVEKISEVEKRQKLWNSNVNPCKESLDKWIVVLGQQGARIRRSS